ncbi:MAG: EscU/YscU/HrcU family type III secretion system export apparatus switch protein [Holophagales bacterium]|nr:EscU/YscU/HrcU family type III secretion system export apparatus switch protein [Holophagales bacterium]
MPRTKRNARETAIALRYKTQHPFLDAAPKLVAKGQGKLAERILELAKEHGIPIHQDSNLTAALAPLDVDTVIPPNLFQAVAIVLAGLYRANRYAANGGSDR